ncbi:MAG TPA: FIST N-terminal domain-containing protein [Polyangiaceae bacterium]|jgi:hypothetical protein|nr:FIST N-terminal domain-containing protein [Polyangiaceae bacterium]
MPLVTGVGAATNEDAVAAVREAAAVAREQCPNAVVVLAFVTHSYPADMLPGVASALAEMFPKADTAGGQVNGITFDNERYDAVFANRRAVAVVAFGGEGIHGSVAMGASVTGQPRESGRALARNAISKLGVEPVGGIFLGVGLSHIPPVDQSLLDGIRDTAPRLRLTGSGLCGGMKIDGSYDPGAAFLGREVVDTGVLLALLGGNLKLGFSATNGMKAAGPGAFITRVEGPEIVEMNGKPAKDVVLDLLAGESAELRAMFEKNPQVMGVERGVTLGAADPEGDFYWCHFPAAFTPRGGVFDGFGPRVGMGLAVTRIDPASCMDAVSKAAEMLEEDAGTKEFEITIAFSCSLRGFTLGAEVAREDAELKKYVKSHRHIGIVANGEIGSYRHGRPLFTGWVFALFGAANE